MVQQHKSTLQVTLINQRGREAPLKNLQIMLKLIIIWWKAVILNYPYWRVENKEQEWVGDFTFKKAAKKLAKESGGRAFIDYNFLIVRDKDSK